VCCWLWTLCHTTQHGAVLIIFPHNLQTITITWMLSSGGEGGQYPGLRGHKFKVQWQILLLPNLFGEMSCPYSQQLAYIRVLVSPTFVVAATVLPVPTSNLQDSQTLVRFHTCDDFLCSSCSQIKRTRSAETSSLFSHLKQHRKTSTNYAFWNINW